MHFDVGMIVPTIFFLADYLATQPDAHGGSHSANAVPIHFSALNHL